MYKADQRIYLNSRGQVCAETDPDCARLLVAEGGTLPPAVARQYGLIADAPDAEPDAAAAAAGKAVAAPPADKAVHGAANKAGTAPKGRT